VGPAGPWGPGDPAIPGAPSFPAGPGGPGGPAGPSKHPANVTAVKHKTIKVLICIPPSGYTRVSLTLIGRVEKRILWHQPQPREIGLTNELPRVVERHLAKDEGGGSGPRLRKPEINSSGALFGLRVISPALPAAAVSTKRRLFLWAAGQLRPGLKAESEIDERADQQRYGNRRKY